MHTGGFDIFDARNRDVVTVYGGGVETESREANARLIAAAPDLLAFADMVARHYSDHSPLSEEGMMARDARAAIAKATGQ